MEQTQLSLLDTLAFQMGCEYLSDLRFLGNFSRKLLVCKIRRIMSDTYDLSDWNDALKYLVGNPVEQEAETAKQRLIAVLEESSNIEASACYETDLSVKDEEQGERCSSSEPALLF